jgi:hypothetical protein
MVFGISNRTKSRLQSFVDCRDCSFQSLHFLMLFEEVVEQHRVDGFMAHRV